MTKQHTINLENIILQNTRKLVGATLMAFIGSFVIGLVTRMPAKWWISMVFTLFWRRQSWPSYLLVVTQPQPIPCVCWGPTYLRMALAYL